MLNVTLLYLVVAQCVAKFRVPRGFTRPGWTGHLRESVPLGERMHAGVDSACRWGAG